MRELLLAYLFGQLDSGQREQVEQALADQPELREELQQLRNCLGAVDPSEAVDPPPDLVERTCRRVVKQTPPASPHEKCVAPSDSACAASMESAASWTGERQWSAGDFAVAMGLTLLAAMFLFPAIHDSRVLARRNACQDNMRALFLGFDLYAGANGGSIPHVPGEGREAFAGIFAVRLSEGGFIDRQVLGRLLVCPATIRMGGWERDTFVGFRVPTTEELLAANEREFQKVKRELAKSYAYRVGYVDRFGRYRPWRSDQSDLSAILADAPSLHLEAFQSSNHGGHGQNVLFADGHVAYLCRCPALSCGDHLFKNYAGYRAAALGEQDNVLVRSDEGPGLKIIWSLLPRLGD